eukprot:4515420-Amphidinium_carterae.1
MPDTLINRLASRGLAPAATNGERLSTSTQHQRTDSLLGLCEKHVEVVAVCGRMFIGGVRERAAKRQQDEGRQSESLLKRPKVAGRYPASPCAVRVSGCLVPLQSTPTQSDGAEQDCCRSNSLRYSTNEEEMPLEPHHHL